MLQLIIASFAKRQAYRATVGALCALSLLSGCATHYVDPALKDLTLQETYRANNPKPVQMLFEFQTKGATNAAATKTLLPRVTETVQNSQLFSKIDTAPVEGGAVLNVVVNNVVLTDNAFSKGFMSGLTLGAVGSTVTDGYICTVDYLPGGNAPKITRTARHAIHTAMGSAGVPAGVAKADSIQAAVETMLRQIVSHALNDVAADPSFNK